MQDFPHLYAASANARGADNLAVSSPGLEDIEAAGPAEFGGPGDRWSPETMLVASVASCFILSFRAIARAARLEWETLTCDVVGRLEKVDKITQFTAFDVTAKLSIPADTDETKAEQLLEKAEKYCLITNSMKAPSHLATTITQGDQ